MATSSSENGDCSLIIRGNSGVEVLKLGSSTNLESWKKLSESPECFCWSWGNHGNVFAFCDRKSGVHVLDGSTFASEADLPHPLTRDLTFSPAGTYLSLWEPYAVRTGESTGKPNLSVYRGNELVVQYYQKKMDGWRLQWTDDEAVCARSVTNEIHFYEGGSPCPSPSARLQHERLSSFALSPGPPPYHLAVHIKEGKGAPSSIQMYRYPKVSGQGAVIANKSFYKADNVQITWNITGSSVLVLTATEVDKTGASYYGEQNLYYLSIGGDGNMVMLDKKGPVYCVEWSPNAKEFSVVYGFMPSKAALFNSKCDMIHDFGITHRNTALYNPHGNILCLAGFGNLRGNMEFWNMDCKKKISETQASDTTTLAWCPDGIQLVTATTAPRLREGNGYKLWHFGSSLLQEVSFKTKHELWEVVWRPIPPGIYPKPDPASPPPSSIATPSLPGNKQTKAYVPPALRGRPRPPVNESNSTVSKNKHKQKRSGNKQSSVGGASAQKDAITTAQYILKEDRGVAVTTPTTVLTENEKKLKNLKKKLKQIETLKQQQTEGKKLEANQTEKLKSEASIVKEISELESKQQ